MIYIVIVYKFLALNANSDLLAEVGDFIKQSKKMQK
jgi:hypothetical protein